MTPRYIRALISLIEHRIFRYFHGVAIGIVFSIVTAIVFSEKKPESPMLPFIGWCIIWSIVACLGVFLFLWLIFWLSKTLTEERKQTYGDLLKKLNDCFTNVHSLNKLYVIGSEIDRSTPQGEVKYQKFVQRYSDIFDFMHEQFCNVLQEHFNKVKRANCVVSIDFLKKHTNDVNVLPVTPLICSYESAIKKKSGIESNLKKTNHVISNTGYTHLISDFHTIKNNTSDMSYIQDTIQRRWKQNVYLSTKCLRGGVLQSEIIVPILPIEFESSNPHTNPEMVGFIHVGASKRMRFNRHYDLDVLNGVADGIYDAIIKHRILNN